MEDARAEAVHRFDASPEQVFALLSDVEQMAGLGPEHDTAQWLDAERTRFAGTNARGSSRWQVTCHVTERTPPHRFAWTVGDPAAPSSSWSYELVPDGAGTLVTQRFQHGPGFSFLRQYVEQHPAIAEQVIAGRCRELEAGMLAAMRAAEALLS